MFHQPSLVHSHGPITSRTASGSPCAQHAVLRSCYLHVGTFKTGTTSIQRFLGANRERLAANGVLVPAAGCDNGPEYASHHNIVYDLMSSPGFEPRYGGLAELGAELGASDARVACLSSENFSRLWNDPVALERLNDAIRQAGFTPQILCYLRPQASYTRSIYAQIVSHHGYRERFRTFVDAALGPDGDARDNPNALPLDYDRFLSAFRTVFGREAMNVRRYRSDGSAAALLLEVAACLTERADVCKFFLPPSRENESSDFGTVVERLGIRYDHAERFRFAPLTGWDLARFVWRFRASNAAVRAEYGVRVPPLELADIALSIPIRRTIERTRRLGALRRAVRQPATALEDSGAASPS